MRCTQQKEHHSIINNGVTCERCSAAFHQSSWPLVDCTDPYEFSCWNIHYYVRASE